MLEYNAFMLSSSSRVSAVKTRIRLSTSHFAWLTVIYEIVFPLPKDGAVICATLAFAEITILESPLAH